MEVTRGSDRTVSFWDLLTCVALLVCLMYAAIWKALTHSNVPYLIWGAWVAFIAAVRFLT